MLRKFESLRDWVMVEFHDGHFSILKIHEGTLFLGRTGEAWIFARIGKWSLPKWGPLSMDEFKEIRQEANDKSKVDQDPEAGSTLVPRSNGVRRQMSVKSDRMPVMVDPPLLLIVLDSYI